MAFSQKKIYNFDQNCTEKAEKSDFKTKAGKKWEIRDIEELGIFHKCFWQKQNRCLSVNNIKMQQWWPKLKNKVDYFHGKKIIQIYQELLNHTFRFRSTLSHF